jgi:uncharacterized protein DUF5655
MTEPLAKTSLARERRRRARTICPRTLVASRSETSWPGIGTTLAPVDPDPHLDPERLFATEPGASEAYQIVKEMLEAIGPVELRTTRSQVAFRRRRGFAYLWLPVTWARGSGVLVVLSIALTRQDESRRWKQVAHPSRGIWMHHLEVRALADLDEKVRAWLAEAYADAG